MGSRRGLERVARHLIAPTTRAPQPRVPVRSKNASILACPLPEGRAARPRNAQVIMKAAQYFSADARPETVLAAGPDAASAWYALESATVEVARIRSLRTTAAEWLGHSQPRASWWIAPLSVGDRHDLDRAESAYAAAGEPLHNVARAGLVLRMNHLDEIAEIEERIAAEPGGSP